MWTVEEARMNLSTVLQRANEGEPQMIDAGDPCVVLSVVEFNALMERSHPPNLGQWLVKNVPRDTEFQLPRRLGDRFVAFGDV